MSVYSRWYDRKAARLKEEEAIAAALAKPKPRKKRAKKDE